MSRVMVKSPSLSHHDEGIRFFFNHYVTDVRDSWGDMIAVEPQIFPLICDSFANAVSSVGYAGLSNVTKDPSHRVIARKKYAASIQDIARALKDMRNSDLGATLKSVVLLAAFEVNFQVGYDGTSLTEIQLVNGSSRAIGLGPSWDVHIDGSAAILESE